MDYVKAFLIGGLICALIQILMEKTKMMPGRIMVLLVCTGAVLGAVGIYEPFQKFAGAVAHHDNAKERNHKAGERSKRKPQSTGHLLRRTSQNPAG